MNDSDDEFQSPENSLYDGGAVDDYIASNINDIQYIYLEFKQVLEQNKKHHYNNIIINKKFSPSELTPIYTYINQLDIDRKKFITGLDNNLIPEFASDFYGKYKEQIKSNDILKMLLIDAIEVSYHCYPYSQNNETLTMD
jgi:hypothetical protein